MEIGTAIKHLTLTKGLTQKVLAEMCDVSANAMNQIENNTSFPHKNTIDKICDVLEIPVSYLLFFSISEDDIPDEKKIVFNSLNDAVKSVLLNE